MSLTALIQLFALFLELVALFIIAGSAAVSIYEYFRSVLLDRIDDGKIHVHERIRIEFGQRLVLALEFLVASDIIQTVLTPSQEELIKLAFIVAVRTVLSFFVTKEIALAKDIPD